MLDAAHPYVSAYLWISGGLLAVCFVVPILLVPLRWAKLFGWQEPSDTRLTMYFGRCLGALAATMTFATLRAAPHPMAYPLLFEMTIVAGALLTLVHVIGAIERSQPWLETAEIGFWGGLTIAALLIYRSLF